MRSLDDERRRIFNDLKSTQETLKKKTGEANDAKKKLPYKSTEDIDARIREIDNDLETGRFKLIEERQMINEISKLRKLRTQLQSLATSGNDTMSLRLRLDNLRAKLTQKEGEIETVKAEIARLSGQISEITGSRDEEKAKRAERTKQITKIRADLESAFQERRQLIEANKARKIAQHESYLKKQARYAELERRKKIEEEIGELEEKLLAFNPETLHDKKVSECNNLVAYFQQFSLDKEPSSTSLATPSSSLAAPVGRQVKLSEDLANAVVINKSEDAEGEFYGGSGAKANGKKKSSHTAAKTPTITLGKLPIHILAGLGDLGLPVPKGVDQLDGLFGLIDKKKVELEAKKDEGKDELLKKRQVIISQIDELKKKLEEKPVVEEQPSNKTDDAPEQ